MFVQVTVEQHSDSEQLTESEYELKRMLSYVTPLMGIIRRDERMKRSSNLIPRRVRPKHRNDEYGYEYEEDDYEEDHYYYPEHCCDEKTDYLGLISLISLGLLFLFLIALLSTTTTAGGRRKRSDREEGNEVDEEDPCKLRLFLFRIWRQELLKCDRREGF